MLYLIGIAALLIVGIAYLYWRRRLKKYSVERLRDICHTKTSSRICEDGESVLIDTVRLYSQMEREITSYADRNLLIDSELYNSIYKIVNDIRKESYDSIGRLVKNSICSDIVGIRLREELSSDELILLSLIIHRFDNATIAAILHKSQNNIRTKKTNLKNRLSGKDYLPFDIEAFFKIKD